MIHGVIQYVRSPELVGKEFRQLLRDNLQETAAYWHAEVFPKHFTTQAMSLYGYATRTAKYQIRKARKFGHQLPLVYTGALRYNLTSYRMISGTSRGATVRMSVGSSRTDYLNADRYHPNQPNKRAELTATNPAEMRDLADRMYNRMVGQIEALRENRTVQAA